MKYELINKELGIASFNIVDLTLSSANSMLQEWESDAPIGSLTLFYDPESDLVYLNKDHDHYSDFLEIAINILSAANKNFHKMKNRFPEDEVVQVLDACRTARAIKKDLEIVIAKKSCIQSKYRPTLARISQYSMDRASVAMIAFSYGKMSGKREERARKKRKNLENCTCSE